MSQFRMCERCVMDTSAEEIAFDENGVCNFCRDAEEHVRPILEQAQSGTASKALHDLVAEIGHSGEGRPYDSLLGLSGGVDSSYLAYLAVKLGLRPLLLHVDTGWNSPLAAENVRRLAEGLGKDLQIIAVDWAEMRDLQLAFYRSSVKNCDIPQDHAFLAALYRIASENKIRYILSGGNLVTESILPKSWGYNAGDARHLVAIHKAFGTLPLRDYPVLKFWERYLYYPYICRIQEVRPLNLIYYDKAKAISELEREFGWQEYGAKHYETVQTRFFQGYYLPEKFGIDKRKAHFSSLIVSGQMTREEALTELQKSPYPSEGLLRSDMNTMADRLGISALELEEIVNARPRRHEDFRSQRELFRIKDAMVRVFGIRRRRKG